MQKHKLLMIFLFGETSKDKEEKEQSSLGICWIAARGTASRGRHAKARYIYELHHLNEKVDIPSSKSKDGFYLDYVRSFPTEVCRPSDSSALNELGMLNGCDSI